MREITGDTSAWKRTLEDIHNDDKFREVVMDNPYLLAYGVVVTQQTLTLLSQVRILVGQPFVAE